MVGGGSSEGQGRVARHRDVGRVADARWCCCVQEGVQPLLHACNDGHCDMATMLVEKGASVDAADRVSVHEGSGHCGRWQQ